MDGGIGLINIREKGEEVKHACTLHIRLYFNVSLSP
jgi:hypothetical protein